MEDLMKYGEVYEDATECNGKIYIKSKIHETGIMWIPAGKTVDFGNLDIIIKVVSECGKGAGIVGQNVRILTLITDNYDCGDYAVKDLGQVVITDFGEVGKINFVKMGWALPKIITVPKLKGVNIDGGISASAFNKQLRKMHIKFSSSATVEICVGGFVMIDGYREDYYIMDGPGKMDEKMIKEVRKKYFKEVSKRAAQCSVMICKYDEYSVVTNWLNRD